MKLLIFAVRDRAVEQYGNPMFLQARGQAIRSFIDEVNRSEEQNMLYKHPEDYDLYELGEYETDTGAILSKQPERITMGKDVITKE